MRHKIRLYFVLGTLLCIAGLASAKTSPVRLAEQCSKGKQSACQELNKMGLEDKSTGARFEAAVLIKDQEVLARIALDDRDRGVRIRATKNLTDQALLVKVILGSDYNGVSESALSNVIDQTVLATIATEAREPQVREDAAARLTDQRVLTTMAVADLSDSVRLKALSRLTVQSSFVAVALEATDTHTRELAVANLTDPAALAKVAAESNEPGIRIAAVEKIADQMVLAKIATEDKDAPVRAAAVEGLTSHSVLAGIAAGEKEQSVRKAVAEREEELEAQEYPLGRQLDFKSAAPFVASATSMFNKLQGGMDGGQFNEQVRLLAEEESKVVPGPGTEKMLVFAKTIVSGFRAPASVGSGITHVQIIVQGNIISANLNFSGPVYFTVDPQTHMLQSDVADKQKSFQDACAYTQQFLTLFNQALASQPVDVRSAVQEEIRAHQ